MKIKVSKKLLICLLVSAGLYTYANASVYVKNLEPKAVQKLTKALSSSNIRLARYGGSPAGADF